MDLLKERLHQDYLRFRPRNYVSEGDESNEENPIDSMTVHEMRKHENLIFDREKRPLPILQYDFRATTRLSLKFNVMEKPNVGQSLILNWKIVDYDSQIINNPTMFNVNNFPFMAMRGIMAKNVIIREYNMKDSLYGFGNIRGLQGKPFRPDMPELYIAPLQEQRKNYPYSLKLFHKEAPVVEMYSPSTKTLSTFNSKVICQQHSSSNMFINHLSDNNFIDPPRINPFYSNQLPHFNPLIQPSQLVPSQVPEKQKIWMSWIEEIINSIQLYEQVPHYMT